MIWGENSPIFRKHPFIVSTSSRHQKYLLTRRFYLGSDQAVFGINIHVSFGKECLLSLLLFSPTIFLNKSKVLSSMHNYWKTSQSSLNPWKEDQLERCTYFPIYKLRKREGYFTALNWTPYQISGKQIHPTRNSGVFFGGCFTFEPKNCPVSRWRNVCADF